MGKYFVLKIDTDTPKLMDSLAKHRFYFSKDFIEAVKKAKLDIPYRIGFNHHETCNKLFFNISINGMHGTCLLEDTQDSVDTTWRLN